MSRDEKLHRRVMAVMEAAEVRRCHTKPTVLPYTVGQHTYGAVALLMLLYPGGQPTSRLVRAVLWHDVAERWVGDIPAMIKYRKPALKQYADAAEADVLVGFGLQITEQLSDDEKRWLNGVDLLEFFLWAQREVHTCNNFRYVRDLRRVRLLFENRAADFPPEVVKFALDYEHEVLED